MCVSPQIVHEQLDGMRDLIFARHIFTTINVRRAFDACVDDDIQTRIQNEGAFGDFLFFCVDQIQSEHLPATALWENKTPKRARGRASKPMNVLG